MPPPQGEIMPPNHLETHMDTVFAAVSPAPKSPARRGISDAALRAAKLARKPYKLSAGNGLYLEVTPNGAKHWRWKYRLLGKENRVAASKLAMPSRVPTSSPRPSPSWLSASPFIGRLVQSSSKSAYGPTCRQASLFASTCLVT